MVGTGRAGGESLTAGPVGAPRRRGVREAPRAPKRRMADQPLRMSSIFASTSSASDCTSPPWAIFTKKSSRMRDASTSAQFGDAGVSFAFAAASVNAERLRGVAERRCERLLGRDEAVLAVDRLELVAQDDLERLLRQLGVGRLGRDADVRAAREHLRGVAVDTREGVDEGRRRRASRSRTRSPDPSAQLGAENWMDVTLAVRGPRLGVVAVLGRQRGVGHEVLHLQEALDRFGASSAARPIRRRPARRSRRRSPR